MICSECKTTKSNKWGFKDNNWYCSDHMGRYAGGVYNRILDAQGQVRDRDWLQHKVDMTSHEKKWHADIKSRKVMPDGSVQRVK